MVDHLSIESFALVGSSGGGAVALHDASLAPDRVSVLVLLCAAADGVEPSAELHAFGAQERALLERADVAGATDLNVSTGLRPQVDDPTRELFREMQTHAFRVQLVAGDDVHEEDVDVDLARITCPVTVVSEGRDLGWFRAVGDHVASALPRADRVELPWAGHLPNLERPAETTELIRRSIRPALADVVVSAMAPSTLHGNHAGAARPITAGRAHCGVTSSTSWSTTSRRTWPCGTSGRPSTPPRPGTASTDTPTTRPTSAAS